MSQIIQICREKEDSRTHGGREIVNQVAEGIQWAQGLIGQAVTASPEASIAWAAICLVLPFFTNPATQETDNAKAFAYVTSRMDYWLALESLVSAEASTGTEGRLQRADEKILAYTRTRIIELYTKILDLQIQCVLRAFSSAGLILLRDMLHRDDWNKMKKTIESLEAGIENDLQTSNRHSRLLEMKKLRRQASVILQDTTKRLDLARHQVKFSKELLNVTEKSHKKNIIDDHAKRLQIFKISDYEAYKNRVPRMQEGTCQWLWENSAFKSWLTSTHACPLLVTADPGCGKSVLTRCVVDDKLPRSATICYFFFSYQSQNRVNQALCALLHQLLSQKGILMKHAMEKFASDGERLPDMTSSLWDILRNAIRDREAGDVIFVVDALDECSHSDLPDFMQNIRNLFNDDHEKPSFKFFSTGRPYEWVTRRFRELAQDFPTITIPGEDEEHKGLISRDIDAVIGLRVNSLANETGLKEELKDHLSQKLCEIEHRTYLWIQLVFWFLENHSFHKTMKGIDAAVAKLPDRDEAYERIL